MSDPAPIFILGFPRSGTTLLGQVLAANPVVAVLEEKPLLAKAIADFMETPGGLARLAALPDAALDDYRADFWMRVRQHGVEPQSRIVVEQTALNTVYLPIIGRLFPSAKIVFAVRDPRDVVFSCFRRQFAPSRYTLEFGSLEGTARLYDATMGLARQCRDKLALNMLEVRNEDVIADFDGQTQRLCAFTGIAWSESMRDFQHAAQDKLLATRSAHQVRRGLTRDGLGIWRRYQAQLAPILPILAPWIEAFGYLP